MKIVFDLQGCQSLSRYRGIGNYSNSLAKATIQRANQAGHEVIILLNGNLDGLVDIKNSFAQLVDSKNILVWNCPKVHYCDTWKRKAAELLRERFIYRLNPDIVHISSFCETGVITSIGNYAQDILTAVTLYDLVPLFDSDRYLSNKELKQWYFEKLENLKKADLLLAISESTRQEALMTPLFKYSNIVNISTDVDCSFRILNIDLKDQSMIQQKYKINSKFILCTSPLFEDPRKNVENLIFAYALLDPLLRKEYRLVLVGNYHSYDLEKLNLLKEKCNLNEDEIIVTGYVEKQDLILLYNLCDLFVFPSLQEGFGLPILEAMRCGAAVLSSNRSSMAGIIGIKEALFDPLSPVDISDKITRALTNKDYYNVLLANSNTQQKMYSWDQSAKYTLDAFELIYDKKEQRKKIQIVNNSRISNNFFFNKYGFDAIELKCFLESIKQIKEVPQDKSDLQSVIETFLENEHFWKINYDWDLIFYAPLQGHPLASYFRDLLKSLVQTNTYNVYMDFEDIDKIFNDDSISQKDKTLLEHCLKRRNIINYPCVNLYIYDPSLIPVEDRGIHVAFIIDSLSMISESDVQILKLYYDGVIVASHAIKKILIDFGFEKPINLIFEEDPFLVSNKIIKFCNEILFAGLYKNQKQYDKKIKLGWISSWNAKCGIAEYSAFLLNEFEKETTNVKIYACSPEKSNKYQEQNFSFSYCSQKFDDTYEFPYNEIIDDKIDVLLIQFNYAFFDFYVMLKYIYYLIDRGIRVVVVFHCTQSLEKYGKEMVRKLSMCDRILVHTKKDMDILKLYDLIDNVTIFPHGAINNINNKQKENEYFNINNLVIGSYGFFLPGKGIYQLIQTFSQILRILPSSKLILVNAEFPIIDSIKEIQRCIEYAKELGIYESIEWHTDFKTNEASLAKLQACDILVFPYQNTKESSSAAVRFGLASGKPVLTTPLTIFNEVKSVTYQFAGITPNNIKEGILYFLKDKKNYTELSLKQRQWLADHDWKKVGKRLQSMIRAIMLNSKDEVILEEYDPVFAKFQEVDLLRD